jgi:hypothetical protein
LLSIYELYLSILKGNQVFDSFNHALFFFLIEGDKQDDGPASVCRGGSQTRHLPLSNADAKVDAATIPHPLATIAPVRGLIDQRGGIKGRNIVDEIVDIDSACLAAANTSLLCDLPEAFLLDFAAAFPPIGHAYLRLVLKAVRIPDFTIVAIQMVYTNNIHTLIVAGRLFGEIDVVTGVRPGRPLSGVLFALALDPFLGKVRQVFDLLRST